MKKKKNKDESFEIFYEIFKKIFEKNGFLSINKKSTNFIVDFIVTKNTKNTVMAEESK